MNTRTKTFGCAAVIVALAGVSASLAQQQQTRPQDRDQTRDAQQQRDQMRPGGRPAMDGREQRTLLFVRASDLIDADIEAMDGDDIGEIEDLIVDRGSGRVVALLVDPDDGWGLNDKLVAIPFNEFRWTGESKTARLAMTPDTVKNLPTFDENQLRQRDRGAFQNVWRSAGGRDSDPFENRLGAGRTETIEGEILAVERETLNDDEHVVLRVRTGEGERRVALGPSWYVLRENPPMRGQKVRLEASPVTGQEGLWVARSINQGDRRTTFRDEQNRPGWRQDGTAPASAQGDGRLLLASEIIGADTLARGEDVGEIDDLLVERNSGVIAFATIDPDENFLGIGDTKRLVPWQLVGFGVQGDAQLDATKDMILASNAAPADLRSLSDPQVVQAVYRAYDTQAPTFSAPRQGFESRDGMRPGNAPEGQRPMQDNRR